MAAAKKDLLLKQGDSYTLIFRVRTKVFDSVTNSYVPGDYRDLTGLTGKAQIRPAPGAASIADLAVSIPDQSVAANRGVVVCKLTPQQTTAMAPSPAYPTPTFMWEVELADSADPDLVTWRKTYLEGGVSVEAEVTV